MTKLKENNDESQCFGSSEAAVQRYSYEKVWVCIDD